MQKCKNHPRGLVNTDHYLNVVDLYALRAVRNRVVPLERPAPPAVVCIGRRPRPSLSLLAARGRSQSLLTGRRRLATATTFAAVVLSVFAAAFA